MESCQCITSVGIDSHDCVNSQDMFDLLIKGLQNCKSLRQAEDLYRLYFEHPAVLTSLSHTQIVHWVSWSNFCSWLDDWIYKKRMLCKPIYWISQLLENYKEEISDTTLLSRTLPTTRLQSAMFITSHSKRGKRSSLSWRVLFYSFVLYLSPVIDCISRAIDQTSGRLDYNSDKEFQNKSATIPYAVVGNAMTEAAREPSVIDLVQVKEGPISGGSLFLGQFLCETTAPDGANWTQLSSETL